MVARQHDLCRNPDRASRSRVPFLIVLQSDLLDPLATVVVAPVVLERPSASIGKLNPVVTFDSKRYRVLMQEMAGIPRSRLGDVVASASGQREEFTAAADLLFTGI